MEETRGRPKKRAGQALELKLVVLLNPAQMRKIKATASRVGLDSGAWARARLLQAADAADEVGL